MKENLKREIAERLNVPRKATEGDINKGLEPKLGIFLVEKGYIKGIEEQKHSWGFIYRSSTRKIYASEKWMPKNKWEKCIFRMGVNKETKEGFFPTPGPETKMYRLLHEVNHAYQEYRIFSESPEDPQLWHEKSLQGEINSPFSELFNFCFQVREKHSGKRGLSAWGNAPQYDYDGDDEDDIVNLGSELAVRAQEDANELVTMYVWHPDYFSAFLDYLSADNSYREELEKQGLTSLSEKEADYLRETIRLYVEEMKKCIGGSDPPMQKI